ncbi:MAG: hypothetical protein AABX51_09025 [Nanoarchaeota archaeon]
MVDDFERVPIGNDHILKYSGLIAPSATSDFYMTRLCYGENALNYCRGFHTSTSGIWSLEDMPQAALEAKLAMAWPSGIPEGIHKQINSGTFTVFEGHGASVLNQWMVSMSGGCVNYFGKIIEPITFVRVEDLLGDVLKEYDTVMLAVCNPERMQMKRQNGVLIYPLGNFGPDRNEFELVVSGNI